MKIGVLFCGFNSEEYVDESVSVWADRSDTIISAVSVPFLEYQYQEEKQDNTTDILRNLLKQKKIQYLVDSPKFIKEHEARNLSFEYLFNENVDIVWLVDSDEIYSNDQIDKILKYVNYTDFCWYSLCFKNFVFDKKTYLKEPFCPPRIFRTLYNSSIINKFYWDNDISYLDASLKEVDYKTYSNTEVSKEIAWINHYSWLNNEIGKRKVDYQKKHFGHCSFKWDEKEGLTFDENYFKLSKEDIPEIVKI